MQLDNFEPEKSGSDYDIFTINHKTGMLTNGAVQFQRKDIVALGVFEQRLGWPREDSGVRMVPICKSPNNRIGFRTEYGAQVTDLPAIGECKTCPMSSWENRKQACGKIYYIPFMELRERNDDFGGHYSDGTVKIFRFNRSAGKEVKAFFSKIGKSNKPWKFYTTLELRGYDVNGNRYSVPHFSTPIPCDLFDDTVHQSMRLNKLFRTVREDFEKAALPTPPKSGRLTAMSMGA